MSVRPFPTMPIRRRRRVIARVSALAGVVGCLWLLGMVSCRPGWYRPASVDFSRLDADRDALVRIADEISRAFNTGRWYEFSLSGEQLNRWIAARTRLWPDESRLHVRGLEEPYAEVREGRLRLAARAHALGADVVVWADFDVSVKGEELRLHCLQAGIGAMRVPGRWIVGLVRPFAADLAGRGAELIEDSVRFANEFTWRNGERRFRIDVVHIDDAAVRVRFALVR